MLCLTVTAAVTTQALTDQMAPMKQRLDQLRAQAAQYIKQGEVEKVRWAGRQEARVLDGGPGT